MKTLSIIIFILLGKTVIAQTSNAPYIYDSTNTIGHIKLIEYPNNKVFFHKYEQNIDQSENHKDDYYTIFTFQEMGTITNRTIILAFDKPVNTCELKCPNGILHATSTRNNNNTEYKFVISQIKADEFSFVMYSKEKIFTKIYELNKYIEP